MGWGERRGLSCSAHHVPASKGPLSVHVSPGTGHMKVLCNIVNKWKSTTGPRQKSDVSDGEIKTTHTFGHGISLLWPVRYLRENSRTLHPFEISSDCTSKLSGSRIEARVKRGVINACRLFRAERFQLVLSKRSCGKGGRSPAMIHTENPSTRLALVNIKTCTYFFFPFSWAAGMFQAACFKRSLRKAAFSFICKARLQCVITMLNWE